MRHTKGELLPVLIGAALRPLDRPEVDAEALAGEVTTVFGNQRLFTDSVRDFYAYLSGILSRYDLGGEEYAQFKELLLVYIDLITADVNRHAPAVAHRVNLVLKQIDPLLDVLARLPGLQVLVLNGTRVTDTGLAYLGSMMSLQKLYLLGTKVTDTGLKELKELKGLRELNLGDTKVTDAGVKELQAALPGVEIVR